MNAVVMAETHHISNYQAICNYETEILKEHFVISKQQKRKRLSI